MTIQEVQKALKEISEKLDLITRSNSFIGIVGHPEYSTDLKLTMDHAHRIVEESLSAICHCLEYDESEDEDEES